MLQQRLDDLAPQGGQPLVLEAFDGPDFVEVAGDFSAQFLLGQFNLGALLLGQRARLAFGQRLALGPRAV